MIILEIQCHLHVHVYHYLPYMYSPPGMFGLMEVVQKFLPLPPTVTRTYLELLLVTELSAAIPQTVTITTLFPTWLRGALKKGAYKVHNFDE